MTAVGWKSVAQDGFARAGVLATPHGEVETPAFMPVATRGSVKALDSLDLHQVGTSMVLANTYHLMLRPGAEAVARRGGLHRFMGWDGPLLTDSGGYQVFSLGAAVGEEGARLRSVYDGSELVLTPENVVAAQENLAPDIAMVLDVCHSLPAAPTEIEKAADLTYRWAERSLFARHRDDQVFFGIVQGGIDPELRKRCALAISDLGFPGFGIGGLSVGESASERNIALEAAMSKLPSEKVRYVMGLGDTAGVLDAVERGADLFDCVWPTRLARHGRVFTAVGDYNLRRAEFADDDRPLEVGCVCPTCDSYSRAFLRHLLALEELTVFRLLTLHNLTYTLDLLSAARTAITERRFTGFRTSVAARRLSGTQQAG